MEHKNLSVLQNKSRQRCVINNYMIAHKNSILLNKRIKDGYRNFSMHTDFYTFNKRKKSKCERWREMSYRA